MERTVIQFRIEKGLKELFQELAAKEERSMSAIILDWIREAVK